MIAIGLTGGIGTGKSTVADLMADRGAVVIDADRLAREVVEVGEPAYRAVVERFGGAVLADDRSIDRPALARIVFADPVARADLEAIVHPAVGAAMLERVAAEAGGDGLVVLDIPLLAEGGGRRPGTAGTVVVDAPGELALARVVSGRGMDPEEVRRRMAAQSTREERLAIADLVIDNSGPVADLVPQVEAALTWARSLPKEGVTGPR